MATKKTPKDNKPIQLTAKDLAGLLSKIEEKSEQREERLIRMLTSMSGNNAATATPRGADASEGSGGENDVPSDVPNAEEQKRIKQEQEERRKQLELERAQRVSKLKTQVAATTATVGYAALGPSIAAPIGAAIVGAKTAWNIGKGTYNVMKDWRDKRAEEKEALAKESQEDQNNEKEEKPAKPSLTTPFKALLGVDSAKNPVVNMLEKTNKSLEKQTKLLEKIHHALTDKSSPLRLGADNEGEISPSDKKDGEKGFLGGLMGKFKGFFDLFKSFGPLLTRLGAFITPVLAGLGSLASALAPIAAAVGAFVLALKGLNWLVEKFGGKEAPITDKEKSQDDKNWDKMSTWQKIESGVGRGIEKVTGAVGADTIRAKQQRGRIERETAYIENQEMGVPNKIPGALGPSNVERNQLAKAAKAQQESKQTLKGEDVTKEIKGTAKPQSTQTSQSPTQPSKGKGGGEWVDNMRQSLTAAGITDPKAQALSLAHIEAESRGKPRSESLNYTPERLMQVFPSKFKSLEEAKQVVSQGEEAIGNKIYGGRMGNAQDEGYKYRGRGLIQLTGKNNYADMSKKLGIDLVGNPDLANDPEIAPKIAAQFLADRKKSGKDLSDAGQMQSVVGYVDKDGKETAKRIAMAEKYMSGGGGFGGAGATGHDVGEEKKPQVAQTAPAQIPPLKQDTTVLASNNIPVPPTPAPVQPAPMEYPAINPVSKAPTEQSIEPPTPRSIAPQPMEYPSTEQRRSPTDASIEPPTPRVSTPQPLQYPPTDAGYSGYPRPVGPVYGMGGPMGMGMPMGMPGQIPGQIGPVVSVGMSKGPFGTSGGVGIGGIRIGEQGIGNVNIGMQNGRVFGGGSMSGPIFGGMGGVGIGRGPYGGTTVGGGWSGPLGGAPIGPMMPAPMGMPMGMPPPTPMGGPMGGPMPAPMGMGQPPVVVSGGMSTGPYGTSGGVGVGNIPILGGLGGISIGKNPFSNKPSISGSWGGPIFGGMGGISGGTGPFGTTVGGGWSNGGIVGGGFGGGMMGGGYPPMGMPPPMMGGGFGGLPPPTPSPHPFGMGMGMPMPAPMGGPPIISGGIGTGPFGTSGGVSVQGPNYGGSIGTGPFGTTGSIGGVFTLPPLQMPNVTPSKPNDAVGAFLNNKSVENVGIKETAMASPKIAPVVMNNINNSKQGSSAGAQMNSQLEGDPRSDPRHPFNRYQDTIVKYV